MSPQFTQISGDRSGAILPFRENTLIKQTVLIGLLAISIIAVIGLIAGIVIANLPLLAIAIIFPLIVFVISSMLLNKSCKKSSKTLDNSLEDIKKQLDVLIKKEFSCLSTTQNSCTFSVNKNKYLRLVSTFDLHRSKAKKQLFAENIVPNLSPLPDLTLEQAMKRVETAYTTILQKAKKTGRTVVELDGLISCQKSPSFQDSPEWEIYCKIAFIKALTQFTCKYKMTVSIATHDPTSLLI